MFHAFTLKADAKSTKEDLLPVLDGTVSGSRDTFEIETDPIKLNSLVGLCLLLR